MSVVNQADWMMNAAAKESGIAMYVLPPAVMINFQFHLSTGKAANVDKAGQIWRETANEVQELATALREAVASVPAEHWDADDRRAYERKVEQVCEQLQVMHTFFMAVGVALTAYAFAMLIYAVFAFGMGTFLAALAAIAAAAALGIITAEITAECEEIAATCLTITSVATAILAGAASTVAAVFQIGATSDALAEHFDGNDQAFADLKQAEIDGSKTALVNLAQNGINAGLAYVNRYDDLPAEVRKTAPKGIPLKSVDLDADRDKDGTWNDGGTATVAAGANKFTAGGHVKVRDGDIVGGEGEVQYTNTKSGFTAGDKVGGYEDAKGKTHITDSANVGYENPTSHRGGKVTVDEDYNATDGGGNVKVGGGATYWGSDEYNGSDNITHNPDGSYTQNPEAVTPYGDYRSPSGKPEDGDIHPS